MAEWELCDCERGRYDPDEYKSCYLCFLDRRADYVTCIWCGRWHSPEFGTCYQCRREHPGREEAGSQLRVDTLLRDSFTCQNPKCSSEDAFMQVDHIKPCAVGGTADPWNLQVLCSECNRWKGSTWFPGSRHDKARVRLMHLYFTFLWVYLVDEQRRRLQIDAEEYGGEFDFHRRRHVHIAEPDPAEMAEPITHAIAQPMGDPTGSRDGHSTPLSTPTKTNPVGALEEPRDNWLWT